MGYSAEFLKDLYRTMVSVRIFEEKQVEIYALGKVPGHIHSGIGEEGCCCGVLATLKKGDYVKITHRPVGAALATGMSPKVMFAELMGKAGGNALGLGGVLHMCSLEHGIVGFSGTLGSDVAVSDGAALSIQMAGTDNVSYVFYGDGTSSRGPVHEAMNLAAIWKLPVLFICTNNQFAISTPVSFGVPVPHPGADRASAYAMPGKAVDGTDVLAVYEAAKELVDGIRAGGGPAILDCLNYRRRGHFEGDLAKYRDPAEAEEWSKKDCLARMEKVLQDQGAMTAQEIEELRGQVGAEMDQAIAYAEALPEPTPEDLWRNLYAE